jgi:hypothetical protein
MKQDYEDSFTAEDLMYLRVAIATFQANLNMKHGMSKTPKTYEAMFSLKEKIDRIYRIQVVE